MSENSTELTAKQDAFVKEYILNGGNGLQAAISAGYSEDSAKEIASENLTKPNIIKALEGHREALEEEFSISAGTKLGWLKEIVERSMQHEQVMDKEGPTGEYKFAGGDAIRAINEINKMDGGHAAEKKDITSKGQSINALSDEEVDAKLRALLDASESQ